MLEGSRLLPAVRAGSLAVFRRLADAEARVHGTTPQRIYFHEVGAVDALVDIVGACLAREWLGADSVSVGPLPLGSGTVSCAHGLLPVPAPAVAELLRGLPVQADDEPFELVTPTGAAILSAWRTAGGIPDGSRLAGIGYGLGQRRLHHRPNLLRALLFEKAESDGGLHDACLALECNLDDQTPELTGALAARLLEAGALDAFLTPIQMKKQRPAALLTVLCRPDRREAMLDVIFRESTTFGVRESLAQRTILERRHKTVETPFGPVRVKIGRWRGADVTASPEFEDCAQAAARAGVPVRRVIEAACRLCPVP